MRRAIRGALVGISLIGLTACASAPTGPSAEELLHAVQAARTAAEHESLAAHYESEAATERRNAERHRRMAQEPLGAGRGSWSMPAHCRALASSYEAHAMEYQAMAVAQRQLAPLTR